MTLSPGLKKEAVTEHAIGAIFFLLRHFSTIKLLLLLVFWLSNLFLKSTLVLLSPQLHVRLKNLLFVDVEVGSRSQMWRQKKWFWWHSSGGGNTGRESMRKNAKENKKW